MTQNSILESVQEYICGDNNNGLSTDDYLGYIHEQNEDDVIACFHVLLSKQSLPSLVESKSALTLALLVSKVVQGNIIKISNNDVKLLIFTLKIIVANSAKDTSLLEDISRLLEILKQMNPIDLIEELYQNQPTPLAIITNMEQFLNLMTNYFSGTPFDNLDQILRLNQSFCNFNQINEYSIDDIQKIFNFNFCDAKNFKYYLQFYQNISSQSQAFIKRAYLKINALDTPSIIREINNIFPINLQLQKKLSQLTCHELNNLEQSDLTIKGLTSEESIYFCQIRLQYNNLYQKVLSVYENASNQYYQYIGWETHWEAVIDFVRSHLLHESKKQYDILYILGSSQSGKSSIIAISAAFILPFICMTHQQLNKKQFCQNVTKIVHIDFKPYSEFSLINKIKQIYYIFSKQIEYNELLTSEVKLSNEIEAVVNSIYNMFSNTKCYYAIIWDNCQVLNNNLTSSQKIFVSNFFKNLISSPCYSYGRWNCFFLFTM
ncbi:Hypothetical_protein [Hexamita inflata]|uniref:Hypothetical_protein n=1 Tax=Hexamita inflata TaxID=28002 RepID=A0AA86NTE1_9EUKA|nr:Hypothetical protein HINF_LOCUS13857 [Hexamita inflata]